MSRDWFDGTYNQILVLVDADPFHPDSFLSAYYSSDRKTKQER